MGSRPHPALPVTVLLLGSVLWGLAWLPLKYFERGGVAGAVLIFCAYGSVSVALLPLLWKERKRWRDETHFLWLMALLGGYANVSFATALTYGEVVRAMTLFYLTPAWGVLGGRVFLGERITTHRGLAVVFALTGAVMLLAGPGLLQTGPSLTDALAITAGLAFAMNNVACRAAQRIPLMSKTAAMFVGAGVMAAAMVLFQDGSMPVLDVPTWTALIAFGLGGLLLATMATQYGVTHMEAGRASILIIMELVAAVASAVWLGGEQLSAQASLGGGLIVLAAVLEARGSTAVEGVPVSTA